MLEATSIAFRMAMALEAPCVITSYSIHYTKLYDAEYGGAPLLGINGTGIICHGASNAIAIRNAIEVASSMVRHRVNEAILATLGEC